MPFYDFYCQDCARDIQVFASIRALEEGTITCPHCEGGALTRRWKTAPNVGILASAMDLGCMNRQGDCESCCAWDPNA